MTHLNPSVFLVWSVCSGLLGAFLISHLYAFDRFKCLRWNQGSQGAFKRVMTYSYITSIPLIFIYSCGYAIIKYREGFIDVPILGVVPKPSQLWTSAHYNAILPLNLCLAMAWALEVVSHLEELCFWMYVVNAGPAQREWFSSMYFKIWATGSISALIYMPLAAIFTRQDPLKNEATIFLAGAIGSGAITIGFFPVLWKFPKFLRSLRHDGVEMTTVIRLTKFHELNKIRMFFRCVYISALLIIAGDGFTPHEHVNENMFATDFLTIVAAIGLIVSSGITLTIFFPRSIELEINRDMSQNRGIFSARSVRGGRNLTFISQEQEMYGTYVSTDAKRAIGRPGSYDPALEDVDEVPTPDERFPDDREQSTLEIVVSRPERVLSPYPQSRWQDSKLEPNRRTPTDDDDELFNGYVNLKSNPEHVDQDSPRGRRLNSARGHAPIRGRVNHFVHSFRSPIDFRRPE